MLGTAPLFRTALPNKNLGQAIHEEFARLGGVDLDLDWLRKLPDREPPTFDEAPVLVLDTNVLSS